MINYQDYILLGLAMLMCLCGFVWILDRGSLDKGNKRLTMIRGEGGKMTVHKIGKMIVIISTVATRIAQIFILAPAAIAGLVVAFWSVSLFLEGKDPLNTYTEEIYTWAIERVKPATEGMVLTEICQDVIESSTKPTLNPICKSWEKQEISLEQLKKNVSKNLLLIYASFVLISTFWALMYYPGMSFLGISVVRNPIRNVETYDAVPNDAVANDADWIEWHGGDCPVPPETKVFVRVACGEKSAGVISAKQLQWAHGISEDGYDIIAYQIAGGVPNESR